MNENENIPKIIHYCWFGNKPKNKLIKKCIKSWKIKCPDYKMIEWNEKNFDIDNSVNYVKEAYKNKKWAFVSDYVRLYVIYHYGGIYLDTDVELIKSLDPLLFYNCFFSTENNHKINTGLGFGAKKENEIIKKLMDSYNKIHFSRNGKLDLTPCTQRNTETLTKIFNENIEDKLNVEFDKTIIFSSDYFAPFDSKTGIMKKTINTIGIHWYNASWRSAKINEREKLLRPIKRLIGVDRFDRIFKRKK